MHAHVRAQGSLPNLILAILWSAAWSIAWSALTLTGALAADPPAAEWPQWRGPSRDDRSAETGLLKSWPEGGPELVWKATGVGYGYAGVSVSGGRLFTMGNIQGDEHVIALDTGTGKRAWATRLGSGYTNDRGGGPRGTPTVEGDRVYALGASGDLACLSAASGQKIWQLNVLEKFGGRGARWGLAESVLVDGDKVICGPGGTDASVVALAKSTGGTVWTSKGLSDGAGYASAIVVTAGGLRQIVHFTSKAAVGVAAEDGKPLWRYERVSNRVANIPSPVADGNRVFFTSDYGTGCALLELSGDGQAKEVYFSREFENHHGGVIILDGKVYGHSGGNDDSTHAFVCMELSTGKVLWKDRGIGKCSITYADGHFYALTQDGVAGLIEVSSERFILKGKFVFKKYERFRTSGLQGDDVERPTWTHPVVCGKRLFLRDQDALCCYDVAAR